MKIKNKSIDYSGKKNLIIEWIVGHWKQIVLFLVSVLVVTGLNFFNVATSQTVASFRITDFEIGQIADRTIISNKSVPATLENPVPVADGETVIKKGFEITETAYAKLKNLTESPAYFDRRSFADTELFLVVLAFIWLFVFMFVPLGHKVSLREVIVEVIFFCLVYASAAFGQKMDFFSDMYMLPILIPSALCVFLVTVLYREFSALIFSFICALGVFSATRWSGVPFLFTLFSCLSASWIVRKSERRIDMVVAAFILAILDAVFIFLLDVIFNDQFGGIAKSMGGVAANGFVSGILALGLLTPFELILNTASVFRLMDLSDLNAPTMQRMLVMASGTYNHSLMVAQLAESACREIGANPLLARVGGYYHDIGKIEQSEYFIENQSGVNKHDEIKPSLSVSVIKSHVKKGVEMARQLHLPDQVIDIIAEHHGNSVMQYFYKKMVEEDSSVRPEDCAYPGNPPSSRESGVVMIADTVEAACKTLENPSVPRLEKFIQSLINEKIADGQLDNSALTFGDIAKIKAAFVQILEGYYHLRIKYPDQKDPDEIKETKTDVAKTDSPAKTKTDTKEKEAETHA